MRRFGRRESGQNISQVFERVDAETLASLDQAHERRRGVSTFFGAREQPVAARQNQRLDAAFTTVVRYLDEVMIEVDLQRWPAIQSVSDRFAQLCFGQHDYSVLVQPFLQKGKFRFGESLPEIEAFFRREGSRDPFDVEQAFDYAHGEFCRRRVFSPGVFEIAVHMSPAVCQCRAFGDDLVELVRAVGLKNALVSFQYFLRVHRMLCVGVIVEHIRVSSVTTIHPDEPSVRFAQPLFDYRQRGGIGLNNETSENQLPHSSNDRFEQVCDLLEPTTHRGTTDRNADCFENLLLTVKRLMKPEFVSCYLCEEPRTSQTFVDWLVRFLSCDHLPAAFIAGVFEDNVLDVLEEHPDEFELVGNVEADHLANLATAQAGKSFWSKVMLFLSCNYRWSWRGATAAFSRLRNYVQAVALSLELFGGGVVYRLASAREQGRIDLRRFLSVERAIAAADLLLEFGNAGEQLLYELVAIGDVVGQIGSVIYVGVCGLLRHILNLLATNYIIQYATTDGAHEDVRLQSFSKASCRVLRVSEKVTYDSSKTSTHENRPGTRSRGEGRLTGASRLLSTTTGRHHIWPPAAATHVKKEMAATHYGWCIAGSCLTTRQFDSEPPRRLSMHQLWLLRDSRLLLNRRAVVSLPAPDAAEVDTV